MPALSFGSVAGSAVATALFGTIAIITGWSVTARLRRFGARPGELPYLGTTPRARRTIGGVVALGMLALVWSWLWSGFYALELRDRELVARYHVPSRRRRLPRGDIVAARWEPGPKASRILVLITRTGEEIRSTQTSIDRATERQMSAEVIAAIDISTACASGAAHRC
jgi:hypothetical protein